jgi:hypothetical protein
VERGQAGGDGRSTVACSLNLRRHPPLQMTRWLWAWTPLR